MNEQASDKQEQSTSPHTGSSAMPLTLVAQGDEVILATIRGGKRWVHRLAEMGLIPGTPIRVVSRGHPGPFIVAVRDAKMVLGHGMARHISVYPKET